MKTLRRDCPMSNRHCTVTQTTDRDRATEVCVRERERRGAGLSVCRSVWELEGEGSGGGRDLLNPLQSNIYQSDTRLVERTSERTNSFSLPFPASLPGSGHGTRQHTPHLTRAFCVVTESTYVAQQVESRMQSFATWHSWHIKA